MDLGSYFPTRILESEPITPKTLRSHKPTAITCGTIPTNDEYPYPDGAVTYLGHCTVVISTRHTGPFRNMAPSNLTNAGTSPLTSQ
jgi:hypothetical protein